MASRLILNADDFGLTRGINRAIAELHAAGALTSATLMANGSAFDDAAAIARANPTLGVGCHVVLTDGTPLSAPETIPTLIGHDGKNFRASLGGFFFAAMRGKISEADIAREATAQIQRLQNAGINVTHLDTHKHTHILPRVARPLLAVAERTGIRAIRNPFEQSWSLRIGRSNRMRIVQVALMRLLRPNFFRLPQIRSGVVRTTNGTIGVSATGRLDADALRKALAVIPDGLWEIVCHPGYNDADLDAITTRLRDSRDIERLALLEIFTNNSHPSGTRLIHYGEIGAEAGIL
ncbi:MAG TPA: ChbG/HpnK family deacetylase [Acidobacteriaceae bacterium]|nr:ChbG/HpnK family deacetylase [Acidobacteriaceae bacterium]